MEQNRIAVVTTCNREGYNNYGRKCIDTFVNNWRGNFDLYFYDENIGVENINPNVVIRQFPSWFTDWKKLHENNLTAHGRDKVVNRRGRVYDYRYDAVRFSHKIAAVTDMINILAENMEHVDPVNLFVDAYEYLIWLDSDIVTHDTVTREWLEPILPKENNLISWLERDNKYPECGFFILDCKHKLFFNFMNYLKGVYSTNIVFNYPETHDSFVIEHIVKNVYSSLKPLDISGPKARKSTHPFVQSVLGEKMDHLKGNIKYKGKTPVMWRPKRTEKYWTS